MHPSVCRCLWTDEDSLLCLAATAKLIFKKKETNPISVSSDPQCASGPADASSPSAAAPLGSGKKA